MKSKLRYCFGLSVAVAVAGVCLWWLEEKKRSSAAAEKAEDHRAEETTQSLPTEDGAALAVTDNGPTPALPCTQKVWVKTFGCSHNSADSETMMGVLKEAGFQLVDDYETADAVVLNSCTVKNPSQDSAVNLALKSRLAGKAVVVAGCVTQADTSIPQLKDISCIGVRQLDRIAEAVTQTLEGNVYTSLSTRTDLPSLALPKVRRNDLIEVVPISTGCLGACTYCKTKFARGNLKSYPTEEILQRIEVAVSEGVQQIWLSSEDTGAYGLDIGTNIAELLEAISETLTKTEAQAKHFVMVRLGMTNPPYILKHLDRLAAVLRGDHFFEFLHLPVQSGSNSVLLGMRREYTVEEFCLCVESLKSAVEGLSLATDLICGFPGEEEADQQASLELIRKFRFDAVNISQFYPRPGTPAANIKRVPTNIVKMRSQEMTKVFMSYETRQSMVGSTQKVWVEGKSDRSHHLVGHTKNYTKVLVPMGLEGDCVMVEITEASKWHVEGKVVSR